MKYLRLLILLICAAFSFSMSAEVPASATYSLSPGETIKIYNNWMDDYYSSHGSNLRWELYNQDALQIVEQSNSYCVVKATNMLNGMIGRLYLKWDAFSPYNGEYTAVIRFDFKYKAPGKLELIASPSGGVVDKGTKVSLTAKYDGSITSDVDIYYTLDGFEPDYSSPKYESPITINKSCTLRAWVVHWDQGCRITEKYTVGVEINATNFPDENFRNLLLSWINGSDGVLTEREIEFYTSLNLDSRSIKNLKGIEYFTALEWLDCHNNQLTALDVSKNTALKELYCYNNQLTALDVSKNTALTNLSCYKNQLTALDVSKNTALKELYCYKNQLTALDVSKNTALTNLYCYTNQLTALDVSKNTALTRLDCSNNQLTALDVSKNTALEWLGCSTNQLTALDVSKALTDLSCSNNQLTALDVSKSTALKALGCHTNQLTALDVSKNTALEGLDCSNNQLTALDVSKNTALTNLYCYTNQLTALDVSKNTALKALGCSSNQLTALDVSKSTALEQLWCHTNQLTALDVSKNTALEILGCSNNQLTTLDVSMNTAVIDLACKDNNIKGTDMDALIGSLPQRTDGGSYSFYVINISENATEGNVCTKTQVAAAKTKGWTPKAYNGQNWVDYEGSVETGVEITSTNFPDANFRSYLLSQSYGKDGMLTESEIENVTGIDVSSKSIKNLKGIECFTALESLSCNYNQLTVLDVSKNTALKELYCDKNQLTTLDVSKNTALTILYCHHNGIKGAAMDALIGSLPQKTTGELHRFDVIDISGNATEGNVCTKAQVTAAKARGWIPFAWNGKDWVEYEGSGEASATTTRLTLAETSIQQGETGLLGIGMDNEDEIIMAEFYMQLPEGITIAKDEDDYFDATLNRDRADRTHTLEVEQGSDGLYHFLAYSSKNKSFTGSEGELISVRLNCADGVEAGEYQGILKNILLSDANKNAIELNDMPFRITVVDYVMGDVNNDRRINGMDIVEMVELVMGQGYAKAADLYPVGQPDGKINGMDLVEEVELVMSQTASSGAQARMMANAAGGLTLSALPNGALALGVTTSERYIMTQFVVHLDDGMTLNDVTTDAQHAVAWKQTGEQSYIVVAYSDRNRAFTTNDALLSLHCTGEGTVTVTNVLMADEQRQECHFASVRSAAVAGIADVKGEDLKDVGVVYDLQGRRISTLPRKKGVYVVDGHKVMR